jgi:hypothetical protein
MRKVWMAQENPDSAITATPGRDATSGEAHGLWWTEASIWTDRMVSALGNGVQGGNEMPSSRIKGSSPFRQLLNTRDIPMRKPATGEPCAGKPHARFGGRGG